MTDIVKRLHAKSADDHWDGLMDESAIEIEKLRGLIAEVIEDGGVQKGCLLFDELVAAVPSPIRDNEQEPKP